MEVFEAVMDALVLILIIIVAAVVVNIAITIFKGTPSPPPPPPATNSVTGVYLQIADDDNFTTVAGNLYPVYGPFSTQYVGPDISMPSANGFTIQYGVDANTNPWIANEGMNVPQNELGSLVVNTNTTNSFVFTINVNGAGSMNLNLSTNYGVPSFSIDGSSQTATDDVGDVLTYTSTPYPASTNCVIIQCSTNLTSWYNIYTDFVSPGQISYFTDTNIYMSQSFTYYNNETDSDGGMLPPGSGDSGTNGVADVPGQAYYRLAYPSNQCDYLMP